MVPEPASTGPAGYNVGRRLKRGTGNPGNPLPLISHISRMPPRWERSRTRFKLLVITDTRVIAKFVWSKFSECYIIISENRAAKAHTTRVFHTKQMICMASCIIQIVYFRKFDTVFEIYWVNFEFLFKIKV